MMVGGGGGGGGVVSRDRDLRQCSLSLLPT